MVQVWKIWYNQNGVSPEHVYFNPLINPHYQTSNKDQLFYIMNVRSPYAKGHEEQFHPGNLTHEFKFLKLAEAYLRPLKTAEDMNLTNLRKKHQFCNYIHSDKT